MKKTVGTCTLDLYDVHQDNKTELFGHDLRNLSSNNPIVRCDNQKFYVLWAANKLDGCTGTNVRYGF